MDIQCNGCHVTHDKQMVLEADAVIFHCAALRDSMLGMPARTGNQKWVWMCAEPPWNTRSLVNFNRVFNWTMTYRVDSDVLMSYSVPIPVTNKSVEEMVKAKSLFGVWAVSNCAASDRRDLIEQLKQFIDIDIFGKCGTKRLCTQPCQFEVISKYKFYFAFENSRCKDYITEKYWMNGFFSGTVPVVMGPTRSDYELVSPPNSFIHVDDFKSVEALASYLIKLDNDDKLYGEFLQWRNSGDWSREIPTGRSYDDIKGFCGVCEKLKTSPPPSVVESLSDFWYG
uniref:Fucosyltransferase n=1 Tax=Ciona intestinalis TaxID=7719 RepID=F6YV26_CIOIN